MYPWRTAQGAAELIAPRHSRTSFPGRAVRAFWFAAAWCAAVPLYVNWSSSQPDSSYPLLGFALALVLTTAYGMRAHAIAEERLALVDLDVSSALDDVAGAANAPAPDTATVSTIAARRARLSSMRERVDLRLVSSSVLTALAEEEARLAGGAGADFDRSTPAAAARGGNEPLKITAAAEPVVESPAQHEGWMDHATMMSAIRIVRYRRRKFAQRLCRGVLPLTLPICLIAYMCVVCLYSVVGIAMDPREPLVYKLPFALSAAVAPPVTVWATSIVYCVKELPVLETQPAWPAIALGGTLVRAFAIAVGAVGGGAAVLALLVGYILALLVNMWLSAVAAGYFVTAVLVTALLFCCPCASCAWYFRNVSAVQSTCCAGPPLGSLRGAGVLRRWGYACTRGCHEWTRVWRPICMRCHTQTARALIFTARCARLQISAQSFLGCKSTATIVPMGAESIPGAA